MNASGNAAGGTLGQNGPNGTFANGSAAANGSTAADSSPTSAYSGGGTTADPGNLAGNTVAPADLPSMQPADPGRLANQSSGGRMNASGNAAGGTSRKNGPNGTSVNGSTSTSNGTSVNGSTSIDPSRLVADPAGGTTADPGNLDGNTVARSGPSLDATRRSRPFGEPRNLRRTERRVFLEPRRDGIDRELEQIVVEPKHLNFPDKLKQHRHRVPRTKPLFNLGSPGSSAASASPGMPSLGMNMGQQNNSGAASPAAKPVPRSERDFEVVVVCDRDGVVVQPGMTRLNMRRLQGSDAELERRLARWCSPNNAPCPTSIPNRASAS